MEEEFFFRPEVSGELKNFVEARLHTIRPSPKLAQIKELEQRYTGTIALPVYVVIDPKTEQVLGRVFGAKRESFLELLRKTAAP